MNNNISWFHGETYIKNIGLLYETMTSFDLKVPFDEWKKMFVSIRGELDTQRKINQTAFEEKFNIKIEGVSEGLFVLIFCLETYYAMILRIVAYKVVFPQVKASLDIFKQDSFLKKGIVNYTCIKLYDWFLQYVDFDTFIVPLYEQVNISDIVNDGDSISLIYEELFPKEIRHSMGEFYTPYWLACYVIEELLKGDEKGALRAFIDPSCGSGTFLVALINRFKKDSLDIFKNICGIDINPLTVLAAKTNYLLQYAQEASFAKNKELQIPIYYADTIAINDISQTLFGEDEGYDNVPQQKYDYVVGNPPWVNWEYLPNSYRAKHVSLWQYYGLFSRKGLNTNFVKEDISVLMTYVAIDKYLKDGGKLGFIIKESLFKSIKQGEGFRKFHISPTNTDFCTYRVEDLTKIKPFANAVTRSSLFYIQKGKTTAYPVPYIVWNPLTSKKSFENTITTSELAKYVNFKALKAKPSVATQLNSGWITEDDSDVLYSQYVLGQNDYVARTGVFTGGANGIYWLDIEGQTSNSVYVSNITERAKNKMPKVHAEVEKDYVFPFLTGSDLKFWDYSYSKYILCPHTKETKMFPIELDELKKFPKTYAYFQSFKKELEERKGFTSMDESIHQNYYYTLQRIGEYTYAKYKVCWRYICKEFTPAVVEYAHDSYLGIKNIIGNEKIIFIGLDDKEEAYYLCGVISSTMYRKTIENFMVGTQITPSLIKRLYIPKFNPDNEWQKLIAKHCLEGHMGKDKLEHLQAIDSIVKKYIIGCSN